MNEELEQKVKDFLNSKIGESIKLLIAFAILKTKTIKDDEILQHADELSGLIAENIKEISSYNPTDKEAKDAGMIVLKYIVAETETKWDDRMYAILDMFL